MKSARAFIALLALVGCGDGELFSVGATMMSERLLAASCEGATCESTMPGCQPGSLGAADLLRVGDTEEVRLAPSQLQDSGWIASVGGSLRFVRDDGTLAKQHR